MSVISVVVGMSILRECQRESFEKKQAEQSNIETTVWIPVSGGEGIRLIPYGDVEVLEKGNEYVRFRTRDGQVIEQHGTFRIETAKRSEY
jgi:DNA-binding LytR/AlgR family response regulator